MERFLVKHLPALSAHCRAMAMVGLEPACENVPEEPRWPGCVTPPGEQAPLEARAANPEELPKVLDELLAEMGAASSERLVCGLQEVVRAMGVLGDLEKEPEQEHRDEEEPDTDQDQDQDQDSDPDSPSTDTPLAAGPGSPEPDSDTEPDSDLEPEPDSNSRADSGLVLRGLATSARRGVLAVEGETGQGWLRAVIVWDDGAQSRELKQTLDSARGWLAASARRHYLFLMERDAREEERVYALSLGLEAARQNTNVPALVRWRLSDGVVKTDSRPSPAVPPGPPNCLGREEVVADLVQAMILLENPPPTPVRGAPGIGKRTVCLAALHDVRVAERFGSRRYYVRCDAVRTGDGILHEIARTVGLNPGLEIERRLLAELAREPVLLVLDGATIPWELDTVGTEEVLTTLSRIYGAALVVTLDESGRPVGPLWRRAILVPRLGPVAARELFLARSSIRFAQDPHLEDLLVVLEGIPVAIELLAQTSEDASDLSEVWNRWRTVRAEVLGRRGEPRHLASLTVTVEQVLDSPRMTSDVRRLLSFIAVFRRGIARKNLDSLLPGVGLDAAQTLVEMGLAFFDEEVHLRTLPPIRRYASVHLPPRPRDLKQAAAHSLVGFIQGRENNLPLTFTREAAETMEADEAPQPGPEPEPAGEPDQHLERALSHLEEALRTYHDRPDGPGQQDEDASETESLHLQEAALAQAHCLRSLGDLSSHAGNTDGARRRYEEAMELFRRRGVRQGEADCLAALGDLAVASDPAVAKERYKQALALYSDIPEPSFVGLTYRRLARVCDAPQERDTLVRMARRVWSTMGRADLVAELVKEFGPQGDETPTVEPPAVSATSLTLSDAAAVDADGTHRVGHGDPVVVYPRKPTGEIPVGPDADTLVDPEETTRQSQAVASRIDELPVPPEDAPQVPGQDRKNTMLVGKVKPASREGSSEREVALEEFASGVTPLPALVEEDGFDSGQFRAIRESVGLPTLTASSKSTLIRLGQTEDMQPPAAAQPHTPTVQDASAVFLPSEFVATGHPFRVGPHKIILKEHEPSDRLYLLVEGKAEMYKEPTGGGRKPKVVRVGTLEEGAVFGEASLLGNGESHFSVRTLTPCRLRIFPGQRVEQLIDSTPEIRHLLGKVFWDRLLESTVALSPILRPLHPQRCRAFLGSFTPLKLTTGAMVVAQGATDSGLFLILLGEVEANRAGDENKPVRLHLMSEGDFFGEIPLLLDAPSPATFVARSDVQLLHLPAKAYHQTASAEPALRTLMEIEARRRQQKYEAVVRGEASFEVGTTVRKLAGKRKGKQRDE